MNITVAIPVKPYLLKFVQYIECLNEDEILDTSVPGIVSRSIRLLITNKDNLKNASTKNFFMDSEFTAELRFRVTSRMKARNNFFFHRDLVADFNIMIYQLFHDFLFEKIREEQRRDPSAQIKIITQDWLKVMGITEDDIGYDSIKRSNGRFRQKKLQKRLPINPPTAKSG